MNVMRWVATLLRRPKCSGSYAPSRQEGGDVSGDLLAMDCGYLVPAGVTLLMFFCGGCCRKIKEIRPAAFDGRDLAESCTWTQKAPGYWTTECGRELRLPDGEEDADFRLVLAEELRAGNLQDDCPACGGRLLLDVSRRRWIKAAT